jgi:DNA-binding transcriptional MerR regulator
MTPFDDTHRRQLVAKTGRAGRSRSRKPSSARVGTRERGRSPADGVDGDKDGLYIQEVAEMLGVSASMLRVWERQGLVAPARSSAGFRIYSVEDIARLGRVRDLIRGEGLNVAGVRRVLEVEEAPVARPPSLEGEHAPGVGERLRRLRRESGQSLRDLAAKTGLSPSHISAIERSLNRPSVAALQKLCAALNSSMVEVLGGSDHEENRLVVRGSQRKALELDIPGVEIHELSAIDTQLEPLMFRLAPGAGSGEAYQHAGEEFLHVLQGVFEITLDETTVHRLEAEDSMTFASHRPHRWQNPHDEQECVILWINTPRTF